MLSEKELEQRMQLMLDIGISEKERLYAKNSFQDAVNDDIISLVDDLSSKVLLWLVAKGPKETRESQEAHLIARRKLIEKIKELRQ